MKLTELGVRQVVDKRVLVAVQNMGDALVEHVDGICRLSNQYVINR